MKRRIVVATLVYIVHEGKVLMAKKVRGVGARYFFGYGGKKRWWETAKGNVIRELWAESGGKKSNRQILSEEGGIKVRRRDLERLAVIDFYNGSEEDVPFGTPSFRVICYRAQQFQGDPIDTMEMESAQWFNISSIPFDDDRIMKPGDRLFLEPLLQGVPTKGFIRFDKKTNRVLASHVRKCEKKELTL